VKLIVKLNVDLIVNLIVNLIVGLIVNLSVDIQYIYYIHKSVTRGLGVFLKKYFLSINAKIDPKDGVSHPNF
jgi:hypothetical protein